MSKKNLVRLLIMALPVLWFASAPFVNQAEKTTNDATFEKDVLPFLTENCVFCHNAQKASGGLDLGQYKTAADVTQNLDKWETVLLKLRTGEMPPKGMPRPDQAQLKTVMGWIESEFAKAEAAAKPDPGHITARRLNRTEYNNTVHDLLGVNFKPADDFPQDDSGYGFDNNGDVLSLSPVLMEKYLTAAEKVARTAVYGIPSMKPTLVELRNQGRKINPIFTPPAEYDVTGLSLANALHVTYHFPVNAEYSFRLFLNGARPPGSGAVKFALWIDGQQAQVRELDPEGGASFSENRQDFDAFTLDFRVKVPSGEHWIAATVLNMYDGLPSNLNGPNPSTKPQPPAPQFKERPDLSPEINARRKKAFEDRGKEKVSINTVRIGKLNIGGPYNQTTGASAESLQKIYTCGHLNGKHQPGCAQKIVSNLAHRAYRRPVTPQEVKQIVGLVAMAQKQGDSFEEGITLAIQAMLVSPHFLFRIENQRPVDSVAEVEPVSQHALASRLSYFLWSSLPDDELLHCADKGKLSQPEVLKAQVQRMLKDPRSKALVENFGGQWLELRKLESQKPDREKFPDFDDYLRMSIRRETELFFENIVHEDRSIVDFIDGNYSFLNERLAELYQIPNVKGPEFRKVSLAPETHRGGILTQASILTVSSLTTRTSPVLRGKWILENILNAPPPPPPPGIPTLDEAKVGTSASLRQQLEEHRKNPTCASCHSRMDPLGFGLENFDAIGAWRTKDGSFPIDSSGVLPDGRTFKGPQELLTIVKADRDAFAQGLTEKLLTYALGRGLERYDKPTVKKIAKDIATNDYRFSSLVIEIVNSLPFQMRRGDKTL